MLEKRRTRTKLLKEKEKKKRNRRGTTPEDPEIVSRAFRCDTRAIVKEIFLCTCDRNYLRIARASLLSFFFFLLLRQT